MDKFCRLFSLSLLLTVSVALAQRFSSHESSGERFSGDDFEGFGAGRGHPLGGVGIGGGGGYGRPYGAFGNGRQGTGLPTQSRFGGTPLQIGGEIGHPLGFGGGRPSLVGDNVIGLAFGGTGSRYPLGSMEDDFPFGFTSNVRSFQGDGGIGLPVGGMGHRTDISLGGSNGNSFGGPVGTSLPGVDSDNRRHSSDGNGGVSLPTTGVGYGARYPIGSGGNGGNQQFGGNGGVGLPLGNGNSGFPLRNGGNGVSNGLVRNGGVGLPLGNGNRGLSPGNGGNGGSHRFGGDGGARLPFGGANSDPLGYDSGVGLPGV